MWIGRRLLAKQKMGRKEEEESAQLNESMNRHRCSASGLIVARCGGQCRVRTCDLLLVRQAL